MIADSTITRRSFISGGAALAVTASSVVSAPRAAERRLRMALGGLGARGSFTWGQEVVQGYSDVVEIVGLCDINHKRVEAAKKLIGTTAPSFVDFDRMIKETHPDTVMVTTVDATHARYIVRALELGCDVMTEKRSEEHTSELQSHSDLVCRLLLEKKKRTTIYTDTQRTMLND